MQIGPYTLVRELARGGMAQLWLAHRIWPGGKRRTVVIKLPRRNAVVDEGILQQFVEEGRLSILLEHTNIVSVFDVGVHDGLPYLVMEYVPGVDLAKLLHASWRVGTVWDVETAVYVMRDVGQGLLHAHGFELAGVHQRIIHRDVSSKNVMVDGSGGVRITDFGVATSLGTATSKLHTKGTLAYMAPEHYLGQPSQASDVFGLGGIFWELLAGRPFRGGLEGSALISAVVAGTVEPVGRDLPAVVERVLRGMLHPDASARMPIHQVLQLVEDFPSRRLTVRDTIRLFFRAESTRTGHSQLHFAASQELTDTLAVAKAAGVSPRGERASEPVGDVEPIPPDFVPSPVDGTTRLDANVIADTLGDELDEVEQPRIKETVRIGEADVSEEQDPSPPTELVPAPGTERMPIRQLSRPSRGQTHRTPLPVVPPTTVRTIPSSMTPAPLDGGTQIASTSATKTARSTHWLPFTLVAVVVLVGLGGSTWFVWSEVIERDAISEGLGHAPELTSAPTSPRPATREQEPVASVQRVATTSADEAIVAVPTKSTEPAEAATMREESVEVPPPAKPEPPSAPDEPPTTKPDGPVPRPTAPTPKPRVPKPVTKVDLVVRRGLIADFAELKVGSGKAQTVPARGSLTVHVAPGTYTVRYRTAPGGSWKSIRYHFASNMTYAGQIEHTGMIISGKSQEGRKP